MSKFRSFGVFKPLRGNENREGKNLVKILEK